MLDDFFLVKKIKEGDIKAFETLFRRYYSPLCWYAASITGELVVGEEIVEELFYVLWRDRAEWSVLCSVKSYLYRAVRNESLQFCAHQQVRDRYREQILSSEHDDDVVGPQEEMEYRELQQLIDTTLKKLPDRRLRIFKMHRMEGKTYAEIATLLSLSVKTIEAEMSKALQALRKEIEHYIQPI